MSNVAYYRVSTAAQDIESQRHALVQTHGAPFEKEFIDEGVSGAVMAAQRPGFAELLKYVRKGDVVHVAAIDRLGRDALDVQATVRALLTKGVALEVRGLGRIAKGVGELILAVLAQVADMERARIVERTEAGRALARQSLAATGKTHRGKPSLGRPNAVDRAKVRAWREANSASIAVTAGHFGVSTATVKRCCVGAKP